LPFYLQGYAAEPAEATQHKEVSADLQILRCQDKPSFPGKYYAWLEEVFCARNKMRSTLY